MPILLHHSAACSLAPRIALEWIGAPYETRQVRIDAPEFLALNPSGQVPALVEDDGWVLSRSEEILSYLAQQHPEADLAGGDAVRAANELNRWGGCFSIAANSPFNPVFRPRATGCPANPDCAMLAGDSLIRARLTVLDNALAGKNWIMGRRSVIDAQLFPMIRRANDLLEGGISLWPRVQALHDRLAADTGVRRALAFDRAA